MPTVTVSVAAIGDDGSIQGTNVWSAGNPEAFYTGGTTFFRFANVPVPAGAAILSATLNLVAYTATGNATITRMACEDADTSAAITTSGALSRPRTQTMDVSWTAASATATVSKDVTAIVAPVLGRAGWVSGNALTVFGDYLSGAEGGSGFSPRMFDGGAPYVPSLTITYGTTYTPGASGSVAVPSVEDDGSIEGTSLYQGSPEAFYATGTNFYRFTNIRIPTGATVMSVKLVLTSGNSYGNTTRARLSCENSDNSAPVTDYTALSRARTGTLDVDWQADLTATPVAKDITEIAAPVFARSGWAPGNALTVFADYVSGVHGHSGFEIRMFDDSAGQYAPKLQYTYRLPNAGVVTGVTQSDGIGRGLRLNSSTFSVAAGTDDAFYQSTSTLTTTNTTETLSSTARTYAFRFTNVTIPPGATIVSANLVWIANAASSRAVTAAVSAEAADTSAAFSTYANITGRARTSTSSMSFSSHVAGGGTTIFATTPVSTVLARAGWASGNALTVFVNPTSLGGTSTAPVYRMRDNGAGSAPQLVVLWALAKSGSAAGSTVSSGSATGVASGAQTVTAVSSQVTVSEDDGYFTPGGGSGDWGGDITPEAWTAGDVEYFRFQNVTVPVGAIVTSASLTLMPLATSTKTCTVTFTCDDTDNAGAITSQAIGNTRYNARTSQSVAVEVGSQTVGLAKSFVITAPVAAALGRPGRVSGNALTVFGLAGTVSAGTGELQYAVHDTPSTPNVYRPRLTITYKLPQSASGSATGSTVSSGTASGLPTKLTRSNTCDGPSGTLVSASNSAGPDQFDGVNANPPSYDSAQSRGGTSIRIQTGSTAIANNVRWAFGTVQTAQSGRFYLRLSGTPAAGATPSVLQAQNSGGTGNFRIILHTTSMTLRAQNAAQGQLGAFTNTVPLNQWIRVEYQVTLAGAWAVALFLSPDALTPDETIQGTAAASSFGTDLQRATFGLAGQIADFPAMYLENLKISNWPEWIGPLQTLSGSASGSAVASGTASGRAGRRGSVAGSVVAGGTAAGRRGMRGSVTGSTVSSGTPVGAAARRGSAAGSSVSGGTLSGRRGQRGTAAGSTVSAGALAGRRGQAGAVSGVTATAGTFTAVSARRGAVTGTMATGGSAAGQRGQRGSVTGATVSAGALAGSRGQRGTVTGVTASAGAATGQRGQRGAAVGAAGSSGAASGRPALRGAATGVTAMGGTLTGQRGQRGAAAGTTTSAGALTTRVGLRGGAAGTSATGGTLAGRAGRRGSVSGGSISTGAPVGRAARSGSAAGTIASAGSVTGYRGHAGAVSGTSATSGMVAGRAARRGTTVGATASAGTAVGAAALRGAVAGVSTTAGTAAGRRGQTGVVAGGSATSGAVSGRRGQAGAASGTTGSNGTGSGRAGRRGATTGAIGAAGAPTGFRTGGTLTNAGSVYGATSSAAATTGRRAATGTVSGSTAASATLAGTPGRRGSTVAAITGTAGTAAGRVGRSGATTGSLATGGAAAGRAARRGAVTGATASAGAVSAGIDRHGGVTGATATSGAVAGRAARRGSSAGSAVSSGQLAGARSSGGQVNTGAVAGATASAGTVAGRAARRGSATGVTASSGTRIVRVGLRGAVAGTSATGGSTSARLARLGTTSGTTPSSGAAAGWRGQAGATAGATGTFGAATGRAHRSGQVVGGGAVTGQVAGAGRRRGLVAGVTASGGGLQYRVALAGAVAGATASTGAVFGSAVAPPAPQPGGASWRPDPRRELATAGTAHGASAWRGGRGRALTVEATPDPRRLAGGH